MNQLKQLKRQIPKYHKSVLLRGGSFVTQEFSIMSRRSIHFHKFILKCNKRNIMDANRAMLTWSINALLCYFSQCNRLIGILNYVLFKYYVSFTNMLSSSDFAYRISQVLYFITSCIPGTMPYCLSQSYLSQMFFSKLLRGKKAPLTHVRVQMIKCIYHIAQIIWLFSTRDVRLLHSFLSFEKLS